MEQLLRIISIILFSSVKFALGPSFVYLNENYQKFTFLQTNLYTIIGGMLGVTVFMYFSEWIVRGYRSLKKLYRKSLKKGKEIFSRPVADIEGNVEIHYDYIEESTPKKRIFTRRNRRIVRIWKSYGLIGLAALTPILFSIPIGTFIITRLEHNHKKILFYMLVSVSCWSLILTSIFELSHVRNIHEIIDTVPLPTK
jgi:hypothetical protein